MSRQFQIAHLDREGLHQIQELEQSLGKHIMAFERGQKFAELKPEEVARIRAVEEALGVVLLVYEG